MKYDVNFNKIRFSHLKESRYGKVYKTIVEAKRLYPIDKDASCTRLRIALEILVDEIFKFTGGEKLKQGTINANLRILREIIPEQVRLYEGNDIISEMHNIRIHGNSGAHRNDRRTKDVDKSAYTSWIAVKKICGWLETFEEDYAAYVRSVQKHRSNCENKKGLIGNIINVSILLMFLVVVIVLLMRYF